MFIQVTTTFGHPMFVNVDNLVSVSPSGRPDEVRFETVHGDIYVLDRFEDVALKLSAASWEEK